ARHPRHGGSSRAGEDGDVDARGHGAASARSRRYDHFTRGVCQRDARGARARRDVDRGAAALSGGVLPALAVAPADRRRARAHQARRAAVVERPRMAGTLYVVATPLGNLEDVTVRALRVLKEVALIAAEDTRHSRKLLAHYGIATPLYAYHDHAER